MKQITIDHKIWNEHELTCPECGRPMRLRKGKFKPGAFYACENWPTCKTTHGCHPGGAPLGTPANKATRDARILAHGAFDSLWGSGRMTRHEAYRWLRESLGMTEEEAHIAKLDQDQCQAVVDAVKSFSFGAEAPRG